MQSYIEGLAKGIFSYDVPRIIIEEDKITMSVKRDEVSKGSFAIKVIDDRKATGFIYSSNNRMTCLTPQFCGSEATIMFEFNSIGLVEGTISSGRFSVVSDAGECDIPYEISIYNNLEADELGSMNYDQFIKLANSNWYEAYKIFSSDQFSLVLETADSNVSESYRLLCGNGASMRAMEEFLITNKVKEHIDFEILENGECFDEVTETFKHSVKLKKNNWGYIELVIDADGDFITLTKDSITTEDFIGSSCNLEFFVNYDKLHAGINFGRIAIYSPYDSKEYYIQVTKADGLFMPSVSRMELRGTIASALDLYSKFRLCHMGPATWAKETVGLMNKALNFAPDNQWYKLIKAMALVTSRQRQDANWILEKFREENNEEDDPILWAFYLYVMTLAEEDAFVSSNIRAELSDICYNNKQSWIVKWIMLHVEEDYLSNPVEKYKLIKECFQLGNNSPLLYVEATLTLNSNPLLVSNIDKDDLAIINWMCKNDCISREVGEQFMTQLPRFRRFKPEVYKLACYICERYESESVISYMCAFLIRMDRLEPEYSRWYRIGIEYELKITRLYEYYISSIDDDLDEPLPKIIYMYFRYNSNLDNRKKAFLYANLIKHKGLYPEVFKSYNKIIEQFMLDQFYKGIINDNMAVIYNEFFYGQLIMENVATQFIDIMSTYKLVVHNGHANKVTVYYHKLKLETSYALMGGTAYIQLYSDDYTLVFSDGVNNIISGVEYDIQELVSFAGFEKKALRVFKSDVKLLIRYLENRDKVIIPKADELEACFTVIASDFIRASYKDEIREELIDYYYENDVDFMEDNLLNLSLSGLDFDRKLRMAEILLRHRYYDQAYKMIKTYGVENISTESMLKLATYKVEQCNYEHKEFLLGLCFEVYKRGIYNEQLLKYLNMHYLGNVSNLNELRKACENFNLDVYRISERIIRQIIFTGGNLGDLDEIYARYVAECPNETLKMAYLNHFAYQYLIKNIVVSPKIFDEIFKEHQRREGLHDVCKLAFLRFLSEESSISKDYVPFATECLKDFYGRGITMKCFRKLSGKLSLKLDMGAGAVIEYITNPNHKVEIHYIYGTDTYVDEDMKNVFEGIFVKENIMFFGEDIQYYITESDGDNEAVVESGNVKKTEILAENIEGCYDMLNDILLSLSLKDDSTAIELMKQFDGARYLTEKKLSIL